MDYELCVKLSTFPILSNSANIGKNLKVYKGVSGRVKRVDKMLVREDNRLAKRKRVNKLRTHSLVI